MKTITKKTAKNGATLYYLDGKRISRADAIDAAVEAEIEIVNNADETDKINERRFLVSVHYDNNGSNGMASKHFATAAEAANYIIAFAKENPEYVINTDTNIRDFDAHKKYTLTDADLRSLNSKPATEEIAEILRDAEIDAAYQKACERVNVTIHKNGLLHWLAKPDNDDWTTNKSIADKILAECGLTDWQFVIKTQAEYFVVSEQATTISEICKMIDSERVPTRSQLQKMIDGVEKFSNEYWRLVKQYDNAPDDEPPANAPDEDDISDICKRTPEDDDNPCLLDWDDSAIGMDDSDKIFADPAAYAAAVEAAFKAQYPEGKEILEPAC